MALWTLPSNVTSFSSLVTYLNYATNNFFGVLILISIFMILFFAMKSYPIDRALSAATFITFVIAVMMKMMNMIGNIVLFIVVILTAVAAIHLYLEGTVKEG